MGNETQAENQDTTLNMQPEDQDEKKRLNDAISMQSHCSFWGMALTIAWWIYAEQHINLMFWQIICLACSCLFFGFAIFFVKIANALHIKNIKFFAFLYYWAYSLLKKIGSCIFFVLAIFFKKIAQVLHIKNINTFPLKKEKFSDIFEERAGDKKYIDAKLKRCSIFNVVAIASLIAATGGIGSPFIAMYVMTYSLTLENVKKENFFHYVMLLFGLLLLLAFAPQLIQFIEYLLNQLIKHFPENDLLAKIFTHKLIKYFFENNLLANIKTLNSRGNWYQIIIGSGVFLSLVIPYLNRFFTNLNNKKNEK